MNKYQLARLHRIRRRLVDHWLLILGVAIAVGGLADALVQRSPMSIAIGVISAALVAVDVRNARRRSRGWDFPDAAPPIRRIKRSLPHNKRFRMMRADNGTFVLDRSLTADMASGLTMASNGKPYVLPEAFERGGNAYLETVEKKSGKAFFNGDALGMRTNVGVGTDAVTHIETVPADHRRYIASDLYATRVAVLDGREEEHTGTELYVDRNGVLRDFGASWLLNAIGTSVLAITEDGFLVICQQTSKSLGSPSLLAPAGSGTLEPDDFRGRKKLPAQELVLNGAIREMTEETGIPETQAPGPHRLLGFGRWIDKGAKPEGIGLTFLTIYRADLPRKPPKEDKPYTLKVMDVEFRSPPSQWRSSDLRTMVAPKIEQQLSVPLAIGLMLLADTAKVDSELMSELTRRVR